MTPQVRIYVQRLIWALPVWATFLFYGTLTHQPDPQTNFAGFAAYVTTIEFLVSHLVASILGAAIGSLGAIALLMYLQDTKVAGRAMIGMALFVIGNTMVCAVFGLAAFAQTAMGRMYQAGQQNALDFYNQVYNGTLFGFAAAALLLFMIGGVIIGIAITTSGRFPRWAGWGFAISIIGFVLSGFLFDLGQSIFSALLIIAAVIVARSVSQKPQPQATPTGASTGN